MQEEANSEPGFLFPEHLRYQQQLVVVYPYGVAFMGIFKNGIGKFLVYIPVCIPLLQLKLSIFLEVME